MNKITKILLPLIIAVIIILLGFNFLKNSNKKDSLSDTKNTQEKIVKNNNSQKTENDSDEGLDESTNNDQVMITNGVKHTVPLNEIVSGGPSQDQIPSIDNPKFISPNKASDWLDESDPGIALSFNGVNRFYPYQVLVWHEIVNDTIKGQRVLVTYCPLCLTGFVMDPLVNGERVEFGTSGKLWNSNLVMYDRKTESYWSQVLAKSIKGPMAGTELDIIPSDQMRFGNWKKEFPEGEVLSRDTGSFKAYGFSPYGDYFEAEGFAVSMADFNDDRLPADDLVFGIVVDDKAKAYHIKSVKEKEEVIDEFQGKTFVLRHDEDLDVVRMYEKNNDDLKRIAPISGFWFSWSAAHPDTKLFKN